MRLKKIQWRNIGPYGNKLQTLELDEKGGLWMVLGKNGNGKSFTVGLPKILYYGKLDKLKKDDIANRLNKHGWISGEIEVSPENTVTLERKVGPSDLKIFKNGEDISKAAITNNQDYIDQEVIGLPYHIFSNIISLSVNDFKSFVSMTPGDKRIIIDKLFSMEIINKMNELIRKDIRNSKINMEMYDREIMSMQNSIETAKHEFNRLSEKIKIDNTKRIELLTEKLDEYKPKLEEAAKRLGEYKTKEEDLRSSNRVFQQQRGSINAHIEQLERKKDLFHKDQCPTCETPFDDNRFDMIRGDIDGQIQSKKDELEDLIINEKKYATALMSVSEAVKKINDFIIQIKSEYNSIYNELKGLKGIKTDELDSIKSIISKNLEVIKVKNDSKVEISEDLKYLSILEELYSDSGVKKKILENYLPTLNKEIEYTLSELHFPYTLKFDNDFDALLQHLGIKISVETLSTGEKKRVDLAVLVSIIRMLKRKYPMLNIFMLDEILSSIDSDGIYDIIGLLRQTAKEMAINVFIINHSPLPIEHFDYKMEITKSNGFSDLLVEKLSA